MRRMGTAHIYVKVTNNHPHNDDGITVGLRFGKCR